MRKVFDYKLIFGVLWVFLGMCVMLGLFVLDHPSTPWWAFVVYGIVAIVYMGTAEFISNWLNQ